MECSLGGFLVGWVDCLKGSPVSKAIHTGYCFNRHRFDTFWRLTQQDPRWDSSREAELCSQCDLRPTGVGLYQFEARAIETDGGAFETSILCSKSTNLATTTHGCYQLESPIPLETRSRITLEESSIWSSHPPLSSIVRQYDTQPASLQLSEVELAIQELVYKFRILDSYKTQSEFNWNVQLVGMAWTVQGQCLKDSPVSKAL